MADVKYKSNDASAGAVPVDTQIRTSPSTEAGHTSANIQHVKLDTGDGTNTQPVQLATGANVAGGLKLVDENGALYGVKHINNKPRVSSMPYLYDIAEGNVSGHTEWEKIGFTPTMTTAESVLWSKAGVYVYPTSDMQMEVVSSSSDDAAGGTGATQVTIGFLDAAFAEKTCTVTLDGTTPVDTSDVDIYRVNSFRVTGVGTGGKPAGNLSLRSTDGAVTYSYVTLGYTRARNSVYCVPAGKTLYVVQATLGYGYAVNQTHYARLWIRANQNSGVKVSGIFYPFSEVISQNGSIPIQYEAPLKFVAGVDIQVGGIATAAGIATSVLRGWLE